MLNQVNPRDFLIDLFHSALKKVNGRHVVEQQLAQTQIVGKVAIIAIGKAASAMFTAAEAVLKEQVESALVITKEGHIDVMHGGICFEAGHPVPDNRSLEAGERLIEFVTSISPGTQLLALISGGTSSLVEVLPEHIDLETLQKINHWLLSSGLSIHEVNQVRQSISKIKGGKLLNHLKLGAVTQFLISDVQHDDPAIIGSGLFVKPIKQSMPLLPGWLKKYQLQDNEISDVMVESYVVANNDMACRSVEECVTKQNLPATYYGQTLHGDVFEMADRLADQLINAAPGIHIWGGETTIVLPAEPGRGGRNQSLALALAIRLKGIRGITVLVGATDGTDGPTNDAGAVIDSETLERAQQLGLAHAYLEAADAGTFLAEAGDLISTAPTGTNVMDMVIALKEPA